LWRTLLIFIGIALLSIALVITIAIVIAETLTRPLRHMARLARRVADGDYAVEIQVNSRDEVGRLAESFNSMTARLSEVLGELRDWTRTLEEKVQQRSRELQGMQKQLMQSEKLASLGKLAAGVAHEINNPMTGILTNASLLLEDLPPDDPRREDLETIVNETIRCRRIVKGLLDFARQSQPEKKRVLINEIVRNSLALLRNQASFRNIEIVEELDPYLPEIFADPNQIQQVFVNILINAAEAMNQNGRIRVASKRADRVGEQVEVAISDTGPGIPPDAVSKLFDPFYTTKSTGTGLGLAVSYGIVQSHGGTIEVDSEPGYGATFIVRLPTAGG
jgi:two-component system NtrC family sensor kinase